MQARCLPDRCVPQNVDARKLATYRRAHDNGREASHGRNDTEPCFGRVRVCRRFGGMWGDGFSLGVGRIFSRLSSILRKSSRPLATSVVEQIELTTSARVVATCGIVEHRAAAERGGDRALVSDGGHHIGLRTETRLDGPGNRIEACKSM